MKCDGEVVEENARTRYKVQRYHGPQRHPPIVSPRILSILLHLRRAPEGVSTLAVSPTGFDHSSWVFRERGRAGGVKGYSQIYTGDERRPTNRQNKGRSVVMDR